MRLFILAALAVVVRCQINPLCPAPPTGLSGTCVITEANCLSDDTCTGGQICCPHLCGKICKDKITETCPALDPNIQVKCAGNNHQCSSDYECGPTKKCCEGYCGRVCKHPVILKPDSCPIIPAGIVAGCIFNENPCKSDSMCDKNKKCCKGLCGPYCVNPITIEIRPGSCPIPTLDLTFALCYPLCTHDGSCENPTHKCCNDGCGKRCIAAVPTPDIVKPGTCPALDPNVQARCLTHHQCSCDGDCENDQKCCVGYCGRTCTSPVKPNPQCPPLSKPVLNCLVAENGCKTNADCTGRQICCKTDCGIGCRDAINIFQKG